MPNYYPKSTSFKSLLNQFSKVNSKEQISGYPEPKMIIKLVFHKEIHVYDLKQQESLGHLIVKVKDLFKKLPNYFVLVYKNPQGKDMRLTTNEELDLLIDSIKNECKMLKLFIEESNQSSHQQTQSEEKISRKQSEDFEEMTQKIQSLNPMDETQEVPSDLLDLEESPSSKEDVKPLIQPSSESIEDKSKEHAFFSVGKPLEMREEPSEREIVVNNDQTSDPKELRNPIFNERKESFSEKSEPTKKKVEAEYEEEKPVGEKSFVYEEVKEEEEEESVAKELIQDDFLSHNARCDICNVFPICGARFQCVVCSNYDLCQKCEEKHSHDHPLLKIRYTFQTPVSIKVEIQDYKKSPKIEEAKLIVRKINLQEMTPKQRRQRIISLSSEMSELLNQDIQKCMNFVQMHEDYSNETLIQAMIENKIPADLEKGDKKEESETKSIFNGIATKAKGITNYVVSNTYGRFIKN